MNATYQVFLVLSIVAFSWYGVGCLFFGTMACRILGEVSNREITYTSITDDQMREALRGNGLPPESIEELVRLFRIVRDGDCEAVSGDVEEVLGRPATSFWQFARDYAEMLMPAHV